MTADGSGQLRIISDAVPQVFWTAIDREPFSQADHSRFGFKGEEGGKRKSVVWTWQPKKQRYLVTIT